MQRVNESAVRVNLSNYRQLVEKFLPFVLIRCTKYTNSKRLAETVAVYTFVCSYTIARMPEHTGRIAIIIACMTDVIGKDLAPCRPLRTRRKGSPLSCEQFEGGFKPVNGLLLFKWEDDLLFARRLAQMKIEECIGVIGHHKDFMARNFDRAQFGRIIDSVMDYLIRQKAAKREI